MKNVHVFILLKLLLLLSGISTMGMLPPVNSTAAGSRKSTLPGELSTSARWIVDSNGNRVKLACLSWTSHLDSMVPEGLNKQPLSHIASLISKQGFNCVRLTWATWMFTKPSSSVTDSLTSLGLNAAVEGVQSNNPSLANATLIGALAAVVRALEAEGVMVILDNHVSKPQWCCDLTDGNGWWGDEWFDADEWISGLAAVANFTTEHANVIGMSLRNEPRRIIEIQPDWYNYMTQGAETVFAVNSKLLVIIAGTQSATVLKFLEVNPQTFNNSGIKSKLMYEMHWYSWTVLTHLVNNYDIGNGNVVCASDTQRVVQDNGFLVAGPWNQSYTAPLFVSEFGMSMTGASPGEERFMDCFFAYVGAMDLDWAFWALQGSYYIRQGTADYVESFGLLTPDWSSVQNTDFLKRLQAIQQPLPGTSESNQATTYGALYHPHTGLCVWKSPDSTLQLGPCTNEASKWAFNEADSNPVIQLQGSVEVMEAGNPATVANESGCAGCQWTLVGDAHLQFENTQVADSTVCLDGSSNSTLIVADCLCISDVDCLDSSVVPGVQWFQFLTV